MTGEVRRAIAFIAGRIVSGSSSTSAYDYEAGSFTSFSGTTGTADVNIYDYDAGCHIGGSLGSLYHYGQGHHIQLDISGTEFSGYDYGSSNHFSGSISGTSVSVYDYGEGKFFNYSI